jgi:hypothetical protein
MAVSMELLLIIGRRFVELISHNCFLIMASKRVCGISLSLDSYIVKEHLTQYVGMKYDAR